MPASKKPKFNIVRDTREQHPMDFAEDAAYAEVLDKKLDHGDYAIEGLEDLMFLERKASEVEIAANLSEKRFPKLLEAAKAYKYRYIICEFSMDDVLNYPFASDLPMKVKRRIRLRGKYVLSKLQEYCMDNDIHLVFCGNKKNAQVYTLSLMKKIAKREL